MIGAAAAICGEHLAASLGLFALLWLAWGVGLQATRALRIALADPIEEAVLCAGLGFGVLSAATLLLGCAGLYRPRAFGAFFAVFGAAALAGTIRRLPVLRGPSGRWRPAWRDPATWTLAAATVACWLFSCSPTVFYDTLVYHFAVPNLYLLRGGVEHLPNLVYASFPLHGEMLFLLGLQLGGARLAGLMNFGFLALSGVALWTLAHRLAGAAAGRMAAALFLIAPPVLLTARFGNVEALLTLMFLLEISCFQRWRDDAGRGWAAAAGLFAGWCFSTKYAGGLFALLPPLAYFSVAAVRGGSPRRNAPRDAGLFAVGVTAAALPWLVKNAVFTGNPVFPALFTILGGAGWSLARDAALLFDAHASWRIASSPADYLRLPWDLIFRPSRFGAAAISAWVWPVVFVGAPAALYRRRDRPTAFLFAILCAYLLVWSCTFWLARLLIPALAIGCVLTAVAIGRDSTCRPVLRGVFLLVLASWTAAVLQADAPTRRSLRPVLGWQSNDDYLSRMVASYPVVKYLNERLPPESRVLVIGESRVAYLRRDHVHGSALDPPPLAALVTGARDPAGLEAGLAQSGITHLLINNRELARVEQEYPLAAMDQELKTALAGFLNGRCRLLLRAGDVYLFALTGR